MTTATIEHRGRILALRVLDEYDTTNPAMDCDQAVCAAARTLLTARTITTTRVARFAEKVVAFMGENDDRTEDSREDIAMRREARALAEKPVSIDDMNERLFAHDMARICRVSLKRFYALEAKGAFRYAEIRPNLGLKSWSRDRLRQHFDGEVRGVTPARKRA